MRIANLMCVTNTRKIVYKVVKTDSTVPRVPTRAPRGVKAAITATTVLYVPQEDMEWPVSRVVVPIASGTTVTDRMGPASMVVLQVTQGRYVRKVFGVSLLYHQRTTPVTLYNVGDNRNLFIYLFIYLYTMYIFERAKTVTAKLICAFVFV